MRRIYAGALSLGFMFAGVAAHAATDSETGTFQVSVSGASGGEPVPPNSVTIPQQ